MNRMKILLFSVFCFGFLGTTYVIKEGGKEVGRYNEEDGKTETVDLNNPVPKPSPRASIFKPKPTPVKKPAAAANPDFLASGSVTREEAMRVMEDAKKKNQAQKQKVERAIREMEGS